MLARALANECTRMTSNAARSKTGSSIGSKPRPIAFFMRKGADCLSKWIGETERQLRLLFEDAYKLRPSIIFFDELDGLAPVRSSRQVNYLMFLTIIQKNGYWITLLVNELGLLK